MHLIIHPFFRIFANTIRGREIISLFSSHLFCNVNPSQMKMDDWEIIKQCFKKIVIYNCELAAGKEKVTSHFILLHENYYFFNCYTVFSTHPCARTESI